MNEDQKKEYGQIVEQITSEVAKQVTPGITKEVLATVKDGLAELRNIKDEAGMKKEAQTKAASFLQAVVSNDRAKIKDLSGGNTNEGAELVPEYFASELIRVANKYGVIRRNARRMPLAGKTSYPTASGVVAYRVEGMAKITSSAVSTDNVTLDAQKLAALVPVDNDLLADANVDVVDLIALLAGEALAKKEDEWGILGLAAGEGIFQNASVPSRDLEAGNTSYEDATWKDLLLLQNLLDEDAVEGAKYLMSRSLWNTFRAKTVSDTDARFIFQDPGANTPATIWSLPVEWSKVMPKPADAVQANKAFMALANFDYMMFGDRKQVTLDITTEATVTSTDGNTSLNLFERDMSAVRLIERVDIQLAEAAKAFAVMTTSAT